MYDRNISRGSTIDIDSLVDADGSKGVPPNSDLTLRGKLEKGNLISTLTDRSVLAK